VHVRSNVGLTFAAALRAFLRQDPDKIMVGEVRDQETAQICMRAALTGHLVLSTLHTNNSLQVINRLVDMGIEPFLLGPALRLVEAQRLLRKLCAECKEAYELPADVAERHGLLPGVTLYRPGVVPTCGTCRGNGTKGRLGMYEVIPINETLRDLIAARASASELEKAARADGVLFLADSARQHLLDGNTSLEEVSEYVRVES
jgi:type IV pilus assembly protein PilB